ncbi:MULTISPECIES: YqaA family protein [unclassified Lysobacter]|uniref:YqaA family protein n=1 Tax=unclassified Lysobacter TaxID=2635362 RepID=UPI001C2428C5|nr:YqaA family protein [Lysobacter sp. MMG2]MBU8977836.1 DedA family protein [Lysobacter sp. MMG2]
MAYLGLFFIAFVAATLLPAQSEGALVGLQLAGYAPWALVLAASVGNVLGSTVNWFLGRELVRFSDRRWFPVKPAAMARAQAWYARYGKWSLLLSWMPIIGDPLTLAAGAMREPLRVFVVLVAIAKTGRYVALALITAHYA